MAATPKYGWPIPTGSVGVAPDVVGDMEALATAIDTTVGNMDLAGAGFTNAGSVHDYSSDFRTQVNRVAGIATFTLNAAPGQYGLSSSSANRLIGVLPAGFQPASPLTVVASVYNNGWNGHTMHLQLNKDGSVSINYASISITGDNAFVSGSWSYRVA